MRIALLALLCSMAFGQGYWSPASLSGCVILLDGDTPALTNLAPVSTWASGCGSFNATQSGGARPIYIAPALGLNHNAVEFARGSSQYMTLGGAYSYPYTVFMVARMDDAPTAGSNFQNIFAADSTSTGNVAISLAGEDSGKNVEQFYNLSTNDTVSAYNQYGQPPRQQWFVMTDVLGNSGSTYTATLRLNRRQVATGTATGAVIALDNEVIGTSFFAHSPAGYCSCDIAYLVAYNRTLSASEIGLVEGWLEHRFFGTFGNSGKFAFVGFNGTGSSYASTLQIEASNDGVTFSDAPYLFSPPSPAQPGAADTPAGDIRDPDVAYWAGQWVAGMTSCGSPCNTFTVFTSSFGGLWQWAANVTCGSYTGSPTCWAPGAFVDSAGLLHMIYGWDSSGGGDHVLYETHPTGSTASGSWSPGVALSNSSTWPVDVIDAYIWQEGSTFEMLAKDDTTKYVDYFTASALTGPWTAKGTGNWAGWGQYFEGPIHIRIDNGVRRVYLDGYTNHTPTSYYYSNGSACSTPGDLTSCTWSPPAAITAAAVYGGGYLEHGTIIRTSGAGSAVQ